MVTKTCRLFPPKWPGLWPIVGLTRTGSSAKGRGIANRRLSILDLAGGRQPLFNEDRALVVVYNGEIYNYPDLRHSLEAKGHRFATTTDTEVLIHAYEEYGPEFMAHLRGDVCLRSL